MAKYCSRCGLELPDDAETPFNCPKCGPTPVAAKPPISSQRKTGRPKAVTVISILNITGGLIAMIFGLMTLIIASFLSRTAPAALEGWIGTFVTFFSLGGVVIFFVGLFSLFVSWGLWKGAEWAWTLGVILEILGLIGGILTMPFGLIVVPVCGLILYYLFKPNVKGWFKKNVDENKPENPLV